MCAGDCFPSAGTSDVRDDVGIERFGRGAIGPEVIDLSALSVLVLAEAERRRVLDSYCFLLRPKIALSDSEDEGRPAASVG